LKPQLFAKQISLISETNFAKHFQFWNPPLKKKSTGGESPKLLKTLFWQKSQFGRFISIMWIFSVSFLIIYVKLNYIWWLNKLELEAYFLKYVSYKHLAILSATETWENLYWRLLSDYFNMETSISM